MRQPLSPAGTSLQGHLTTSYRTLRTVLGLPMDCSGYDKVDAQWTVQINSVFFTIYNYKDGKNYLGAKGKPVEQITDWHIGGEGPEAAIYVAQLFPTEKVRVAR